MSKNIVPLLPIIVGLSLVAVYKRTVDERTGKETVERIHEGIVVQDAGNMVRVFNPAPLDKGGDTAPENAEFFALDAKSVWCESIGHRAEPFKLPPTLVG